MVSKNEKIILLQQLKSSNCIIHEGFVDDIQKLVMGTGNEKEFFRMVIKGIQLVKELGNDVLRLKNFEKLKNAEELYSMKLKGSRFNYRVLYTFGENSNTILLHLFFERDDAGKGRYETHMPIALERMRELKGKKNVQ